MNEMPMGSPEYTALPDIKALLAIISDLVGEVHPKWKYIHFTPNTLLERELGLDSLARMELCSRINKALTIELDAHAAIRAATPLELQCAIQATITGTEQAAAGGRPDTGGNENPADLLLGDFTSDELPATGKPAKHGLREWLYAIYCWPVFMTLAIISWFLVVLTPVQRWRQWLGRGLTRLLFRMTFIPLTVNGREHLVSDETMVIVANHTSYLDGFIMIAALDTPVHFIVKGELSRITLVRLILQRFGVEFVDRFNAGRGASSVRRIARKSRHGHSLVFFPEGTFISFPGLQPFRMGAFVTAARTGKAILPVAIKGARDIVRGNDWFPHRGRITVTIRPPVMPEGSGWQHALLLRDAARREISAYCGEPDMIELYAHADADSSEGQ